jgi:toxin FitB
MLIDSNILIYCCKPGGEQLRPWLEQPRAAISIVSKIEALGFAGIGAEERAALSEAFQSIPILSLTDPIADHAIALRQSRKMSLADAIIAATAIIYDFPLVTRDVDGFKHIVALRLINPFATTAAD